MIVDIHGCQVLVEDDRLNNRQTIAHIGNNLRKCIHERRMKGEDDGATDQEVLGLLLRIIAHDDSYGAEENIGDRKKSLFNIARSIPLLNPKKATSGQEKFVKEKYVSADERSIWRDTEFLQKMLISEGQPGYEGRYFIPDSKVKKILEQDVRQLAKAIADELQGVVALDERYKDTRELQHVYEIANYYREEEALKKILDYTRPELLAQIDTETVKGKFALFRILVIIGEYVSKKNLTDGTKGQVLDLDWELLTAIRNRLAHHEWYLAHEDVFANLVKFDLKHILNEDLPYIRQKIGVIWVNHQNVKRHLDVHERFFSRDVSDYYRLEDNTDFIPKESEQYIAEHCRWLHDKGFISADYLLLLLDFLNKDFEIIYKEFRGKLKEYIGEDKFSQDSSVDSDEVEAIKNVVHAYNQISGQLLRKLDNKLLNKFIAFINKLYKANFIEQEKALEIKEQCKKCKTPEELMLVLGKAYTPLSKLELEVLRLYNSINNGSKKKKSGNIRDLYKLLGEKGVPLSDSDEIIQKIIDEKPKDISEQIDSVKLGVIEKYIKEKAIDKIDGRVINFSEEYFALKKLVIPVVAKGLMTKIEKLLQDIKVLGYVDDHDIAGIIAVLNSNKIDDFLSMLKYAIGEDKFEASYFDQYRSEEILKINEMRQRFGDVDKEIDKVNMDLINQQQRAERNIERERERHLDGFRKLKDLLPDEDRFFAKKNTVLEGYPAFDQLKVISSAVPVVRELSELLNTQDFAALRDVQRGFAEEMQFVEIDAEMWDRVMVRALVEDPEYVQALTKLQEYEQTDKAIVPLSWQAITDDDIITGRERSMSMTENQLKDYLEQNVDFIKARTVNRACFIETCQALRGDEVTRLAVEYGTSIVWPYLSEIQEDYLTDMPEMFRVELKGQRNVAQHGNIYVDMLVSDRLDEFLVRYSSIFIKDVQPRLAQLEGSLIVAHEVVEDMVNEVVFLQNFRDKYEVTGILGWLNSYVEGLFRDYIKYSKFKDMQYLADKHRIDVVVDKDNLKSVYHKLARKTHPDKIHGYEDDFKSVTAAREFLEQNDDEFIVSDLYKPIMSQLQKVNIGIKVADTFVDIGRLINSPDGNNILKIGVDFIQLAGVYMQSPIAIISTTAIDSFHQVYEDNNFLGAISSVAKNAGLTMAMSAISANAPALYVVTTAGFTLYGGCSVVKNIYDLYYEIFPEQSELEH